MFVGFIVSFCLNLLEHESFKIKNSPSTDWSLLRHFIEEIVWLRNEIMP